MNIVTVGDSWASAVEGDTKRDAGWPEILGLPSNLRLALRGSRATQWGQDFPSPGRRGHLTLAVEAIAKNNPDAVVVSLLGNDAREMLNNRNFTVEAIQGDVLSLRRVVETVYGPPVIVMLYTDPLNSFLSRIAVRMLNSAIRQACSDLPVAFADTNLVLKPEHFVGGIFIPHAQGMC